jgi:two-component system, chemotaxis family, chemotaxis protein CheY
MKILIVDDSKGMRGVVRRTLRAAGIGAHTCDEASNGLEALRAIHEFKPDVVLTDWNMPEMSGLELIKTLREAGNPIRVGFITSEGTDDMKQAAMGAGANFVLVKPVSPDAIKAAFQGFAP